MLFYKEMTEELIKEILAQVRLILIMAILSDKWRHKWKCKVRNKKWKMILMLRFQIISQDML